MSCNAYNHPLDCNWGWGGEYHQSCGTPDVSIDYWGDPKSYTNPNARCPICKSACYFYRSPNGGGVYFDALGPPWPKHPCLHQADVPNTYNDGRHWWPFPVAGMFYLQESKQMLLFGHADKVLVADIRLPCYLTGDPHSPIYISRAELSTGHYLLATFRVKNGRTIDIKTRATSIISEAVAVEWQRVVEGIQSRKNVRLSAS